MSKHITEDLVDQLAIVAYENIRLRSAEAPLPSWTALNAVARYQQKLQVVEVLNMVIPVLIEQGWAPPTQAREPWKYFGGVDDV